MKTRLLLWLLCSVCSVKLQAQTCYSSASFYFGCPPLTVQFQDLSTGSPVSHFWNFDDNPVSTSTMTNPGHTYLTPGYHNVMHIVNFGGGNFDTCYLTIHVYQPPILNISSTSNTGCIPHTVNIQNLSQPGSSPVTSWVWNFGGCAPNSTAFNPPPFTLNATGSCNLTLIAQDQLGCQSTLTLNNYIVTGTPPTASMTYSPASSCSSPLAVNFNNTSTGAYGPLTADWQLDPGTSTAWSPSTVYFNGFHDPMLVVSNSLGCTDTAYGHIEVTQLNAAFTTSSPGACLNLPFNFYASTTFQVGTPAWSFGDGSPVMNVWNPTHIYTANGNYTVTFTITYGNCSHSQSQTVNVSTPINFNMSVADSTNCTAPFTAQFSCSAAGAASYAWNFGDGSPVSTLQNPSHTYTSTGSFTVTLGVGNSNGCVNTNTWSNWIDIAQPVVAFTMDPDTGCTPLAVQFTNQTSSISPITSVLWNFGNGQSSNGANPTYTYNTAGTFMPTLTVTNADGCTASAPASNAVLAIPAFNASFSIADTQLCLPDWLSITNTSTAVPPGAFYLWSYGDGTYSYTPTPSHQYTSPGTYQVMLYVAVGNCIDSAGPVQVVVRLPRANFGTQFSCTNPTTVAFIDSSQGANSWLWNFGDGTTSTQQNPQHTFPGQGTYNVILSVYNNSSGCTDTMLMALQVLPPQAGFSADSLVGCRPLHVTFTDTSIAANSWWWDFGDGTAPSTLPNPYHVYTDTGLFTVTLIINAGTSCPDTIVKTNYIRVNGVFANFIGSPTTGCVPLTVNFTDQSTSYQGSIVSWAWDFFDGTSSTVQNPQKTYYVSGQYNVKLTVTDNNGCTRSRTRPNYIRPRKPNPSFVCDTFVCPNEPVQFTNTTTPNVPNYTWNFGDGNTSTQTSPTHSYSQQGYYTIVLTAVDQYGCDSTLIKLNHVHVDTPTAGFVVSSNFSPCPPFAVQFNNTTDRPDMLWLWSFGDGTTDTAMHPVHVYFHPGVYTVSLTAYNASGCMDDFVQQNFITVNGPIANYTLSADTGCGDLVTQLSGNTIGSINTVIDMGDGTLFGDTGSVTYVYSTPGTFYPIVLVVDTLGCSVPYFLDTIVVGIIPLPNLPPDTLVCQGNYVPFNLTGGDHYLWSPGTFLTCDTCGVTVCQSPDTITYIVHAWTDIGCHAYDTITVNVEPLPQLNPGTLFRICVGESLQLHAGNVSSCYWSPSLYMDDSTLVNPTVTPPDSMEYRVTAGNAAGCILSKIVKVYTITEVISSVVGDTVLCLGEGVQLNTTVTQASWNDTSFIWLPPAYLSNPYGEDPFCMPLAPVTYTLIVSSPFCESDTHTIVIDVIPLPQLVAGDDQTVAPGTEIQLYASVPDNVTYQWSAIDPLSCTDCRRPFLTANQSQVVYVTATNYGNCFSTDSVVITVVDCGDAGVFVPNTFTPNGDGLNDVLYVRGGGIKTLEHFRIFDRWGKMVFESNELNEGWDGGRFTEGVFIYTAAGTCTNGESFSKRGNVLLMK